MTSRYVEPRKSWQHTQPSLRNSRIHMQWTKFLHLQPRNKEIQRKWARQPLHNYLHCPSQGRQQSYTHSYLSRGKLYSWNMSQSAQFVEHTAMLRPTMITDSRPDTDLLTTHASWDGTRKLLHFSPPFSISNSELISEPTSSSSSPTSSLTMPWSNPKTAYLVLTSFQCLQQKKHQSRRSFRISPPPPPPAAATHAYSSGSSQTLRPLSRCRSFTLKEISWYRPADDTHTTKQRHHTSHSAPR